MTSEVEHECAIRRPAELGKACPEIDATRQEESLGDLSSETGADTAKITSCLVSTAGRMGVAGNSMLMVADTLEESLCRPTEGEKEAEKRSRSGYDHDDLASRENSVRDCATQRQQQLLPVSRSQYHSIQQLSRPSTNVAQTAPGSHRLFGTELYTHSSGQAPSSAEVAPGRYFTEKGRLRDEKNKDTESERRPDDDRAALSDSDDGDEGSACTEYTMDFDEQPSDVDRNNEHVHKATVNVTSKSWSSEDRQNGGRNTAVEDELEAKRARVEHIVRSIQTPPSDGQQSSMIAASQTTHQQQHMIDGRRQRRKQFAPLQHQNDGRQAPHVKRSYVADDDDSDRDVDETWVSQLENSERDALRLGLQRVQDRLADMQKKYVNYLDESSEDDVIVDVDNEVRTDEPIKRLRDNADDTVIGADFNRNEILRGGDSINDNGSNDGSGSGSLEALARMLKAEISDSVGTMVDEIVHSFVARRLKVGGSSGGAWRHDDPADGRLTPTQRSTMSTTSSPDTHLTTPSCTDTDTAPPPLTPIGTSTAVDLRFPVLPPAPPATAVIPAGSMGAMERAAAAAAKLVVDRYSLQSAAAMAAYFDNAFLLHGKTAFEMPPPSHAASSSTSPASATRRLFTPTPFYPAQNTVLQPHVIKVNIFFSFLVYDFAISFRCS